MPKPAVTWDLGFIGLVRSTAPKSPFTTGKEGPNDLF